MKKSNILVVDNFDSFTFNLVHLIEKIDETHFVCRNDELSELDLTAFTHLLIGPGPGLPNEAGQLMEIISRWEETKPLLGICLGMQAMLEREGGEIQNLHPVHHGSQETVHVINSNVIFEGIPNKFQAGRYHSWAFCKDNVPSTYNIIAEDDSGIVMTVEHKSIPWYGIQFHPESIMTEFGLEMMRNFCNMG